MELSRTSTAGSNTACDVPDAEKKAKLSLGVSAEVLSDVQTEAGLSTPGRLQGQASLPRFQPYLRELTLGDRLVTIPDYSHDPRFAETLTTLSRLEVERLRELRHQYPDHMPMPGMARTVAELDQGLAWRENYPELPASEQAVIQRMRTQLARLEVQDYNCRASTERFLQALVYIEFLDHWFEKQMAPEVDPCQQPPFLIELTKNTEPREYYIRKCTSFMPNCTLHGLEQLPWNTLLEDPPLFTLRSACLFLNYEQLQPGSGASNLPYRDLHNHFGLNDTRVLMVPIPGLLSIDSHMSNALSSIQLVSFFVEPETLYQKVIYTPLAGFEHLLALRQTFLNRHLKQTPELCGELAEFGRRFHELKDELEPEKYQAIEAALCMLLSQHDLHESPSFHTVLEGLMKGWSAVSVNYLEPQCHRLNFKNMRLGADILNRSRILREGMRCEEMLLGVRQHQSVKPVHLKGKKQGKVPLCQQPPFHPVVYPLLRGLLPHLALLSEQGFPAQAVIRALQVYHRHELQSWKASWAKQHVTTPQTVNTALDEDDLQKAAGTARCVIPLLKHLQFRYITSQSENVGLCREVPLQMVSQQTLSREAVTRACSLALQVSVPADFPSVPAPAVELSGCNAPATPEQVEAIQALVIEHQRTLRHRVINPERMMGLLALNRLSGRFCHPLNFGCTAYVREWLLLQALYSDLQRGSRLDTRDFRLLYERVANKAPGLYAAERHLQRLSQNQGQTFMDDIRERFPGLDYSEIQALLDPLRQPGLYSYAQLIVLQFVKQQQGIGESSVTEEQLNAIRVRHAGRRF